MREDEDFVTRCYYERDPNTIYNGGIEYEQIIEEDFDAIIVESYASIPYQDVEKLVVNLKDRGVPSYIFVHEGSKEEMKYSALNIFNGIIVFDSRYMEMLKGYGENFTIIPYPCNPVIEGNRKFMEDGLKLFSFGRQPEREYIDFIESLKKLRSRYEFTYKIVRSNGLLTFNEKWIIQEQRRLGETSEIYNLLHSSDIHLLPKRKTDKVVVSSTLC
ncbi:MAG TPA: hypothetical protein ENI44_04325 [Thermoplasmatales archaeon]|nr:hypothetical protein [Thermoplasmatales archaeon]